MTVEIIAQSGGTSRVVQTLELSVLPREGEILDFPNWCGMVTKVIHRYDDNHPYRPAQHMIYRLDLGATYSERDRLF